jgi:GT2 family glycosyltransferase
VIVASVIIVTYDGLRFLPPCLTAALAQELEGEYEVIVVDNGSHDESVRVVRESFPTVRVITAGRNLGFAGGNNLGMRTARGRYVVLLNNDTQVRPGWLQALVRTAEADSRIGAVAAKLLFRDPPNTVQNAGSLLLSDGSGADRGFREADRGQYDRAEEVFGVCGASALYRREMLDDVGTFDDTFFMYYEDTDLNWRMRLRGWAVWYQPAAVVDHVHAGSSKEWSPFFIFHVDRNRLFMILKNAPLRFVLRTFAHFARLSYRAARESLAIRSRLSLPLGGRAGEGVSQTGRARIHARVVLSLLWHLPEMMAKRWRIRGRQRVADADVLRWLYPRDQWDAR